MFAPTVSASKREVLVPEPAVQITLAGPGCQNEGVHWEGIKFIPAVINVPLTAALASIACVKGNEVQM